MKHHSNKLFILCALVALLAGCKNQKMTFNYSIDTPTEISQQIGDAMAAIDESGGFVSGDITKAVPFAKETSYARFNPAPARSMPFYELAIPKAEAGTCTSVAFGACSSNAESRVISGCTTAASGGTLAGSITLTYTGSGAASCTIPAATDSVARVANISVRGLRGAQFGTRPNATGQVLTRVSAAPDIFSYNDTGTRRSFTDPDSKVLLNLNLTTPTPLTVNGAARNGRTITAGDLLVTDALTSVTCDFAPTGVTWTTGCNCPTSGSWTATCSDSKNFSVAFTSTCGQATVSVDSVSSTVTMDRCDTN